MRPRPKHFFLSAVSSHIRIWASSFPTANMGGNCLDGRGTISVVEAVTGANIA